MPPYLSRASHPGALHRRITGVAYYRGSVWDWTHVPTRMTTICSTLIAFHVVNANRIPAILRVFELENDSFAGIQAMIYFFVPCAEGDDSADRGRYMVSARARRDVQQATARERRRTREPQSRAVAASRSTLSVSSKRGRQPAGFQRHVGGAHFQALRSEDRQFTDERGVRGWRGYRQKRRLRGVESLRSSEQGSGGRSNGAGKRQESSSPPPRSSPDTWSTSRSLTLVADRILVLARIDCSLQEDFRSACADTKEDDSRCVSSVFSFLSLIHVPDLPTVASPSAHARPRRILAHALEIVREPRTPRLQSMSAPDVRTARHGYDSDHTIRIWASAHRVAVSGATRGHAAMKCHLIALLEAPRRQCRSPPTCLRPPVRKAACAHRRGMRPDSARAGYLLDRKNLLLSPYVLPSSIHSLNLLTLLGFSQQPCACAAAQRVHLGEHPAQFVPRTFRRRRIAILRKPRAIKDPVASGCSDRRKTPFEIESTQIADRQPAIRPTFSTDGSRPLLITRSRTRGLALRTWHIDIDVKG
ncbi:hypothetical protein FB451DRAFT_1366088 [Mycena latifolia]|nr:hypothetical protein FB451DRAFT_1366088 [Mycena latifolia]